MNEATRERCQYDDNQIKKGGCRDTGIESKADKGHQCHSNASKQTLSG